MKKHRRGTGLAVLGMTTVIGMLLCGTGGPAAYAADGDVAIDAVNFPDEVFREYVQTEFDSDRNGILSLAECAAVSRIGLSGSNISDLQGISFFANLTKLNCSDNNLSSLDVSRNTNLTELYFMRNNLSSLDISSNVNLRALDCKINNITSLNVNENPDLTSLDCSFNNISSLDVSQNVNLKYLNCSGNSISSLNVSRNLDLSTLVCNNNNINSLNVNSNIKLEKLWCESNKINNLDVSQNVNLVTLFCQNNGINSLNLNRNVNLEYLYCSFNNISSLDVSQNRNLTLLNCSYNNLSSLNLSQNGSFSNTQAHTSAIVENKINVTAYQDGSAYYIDMTGFQLDQNRISNPSKGSYNPTNGKIILDAPVQVGDILTYDYATGYTGSEQEFKMMTVTIYIAEVKEASATENTSMESTTEASGSDSEAVSSTQETVTTAASQRQDSPKTGDNAMPGWIMILGLFCISVCIIGKRGRK